MTLEEMKAIAMRLPEAINSGDLSAFDQVTAPNAVDHAVPPGLPPTVEGTKMFLGAFRAAFPDLHYKVDDTIAEGDRVVQRITGTGTMKGDFQGMPASNKSATWSEIHIVRFQNGKVSEHWAVVDQLSMLAQLGFASMPGAH
jgi:steroid delta-isomerase-like uncharacterized protein